MNEPNVYEFQSYRDEFKHVTTLWKGKKIHMLFGVVDK